MDDKICQHCNKKYKLGNGYTYTFESEAWGFGIYGCRASLCRTCARKFAKKVRKLNDKIIGRCDE